MREPGPVGRWVIGHDDSKLFVVLYIGLAVVLSIWLGLFWLVAIVAAHLLLEWVRQAWLQPGTASAFLRALWELKLDAALVLFAFWLALYMDLIAGVVGLGAGMRAVSQAGARAAAWQRVLRGVLLSLDDVAQVARVAARGRARTNPALSQKMLAGAEADAPAPAPELEVEVDSRRRGWSGWWSLGDRLTLGFGGLCALLILTAPLTTAHTWESTWRAVAVELRPFPREAISSMTKPSAEDRETGSTGRAD